MAFGDFATAAQFRDVVVQIVRGVLRLERPPRAYATVTAIDNPNNRVSVTFPGETTSVWVPVGSLRPSAIGQVVRIAGEGGDHYVEDVVGAAPFGLPPGTVVAFASGLPAPGWLICDGQLISRALYPGLLAAIGVAYGAGDGSTTFAVPDYRGRVLVAKEQSNTLGTGVTAINSRVGTATHALTTAQMPAHTHGLSALMLGAGGATLRVLADGLNFPASQTTDSAGSGTAHPNMQPSVGVDFIIKT